MRPEGIMSENFKLLYEIIQNVKDQNMIVHNIKYNK